MDNCTPQCTFYCEHYYEDLDRLFGQDFVLNAVEAEAERIEQERSER